MKKKSLIAGAALIVVTLVFSVILVANFNGLKTLTANPQIEFKTTPPIQNINPNIKGLNDAFVEISNKVTPSVVYIEVTGEVKKEDNQRKFDFFFGPDFNFEEPPLHGSGSGVIISQDGYILTNNHVIKNASDKGIKVILTDKREFSAKLIGSDPNTDVAVIKIEADNLTVASVGNSDNVQVGQWVLAIGNPLGLNNTVTAGIVSALGRNVQVNTDSYAINNFIQTDAVINPGNSGGALVDINGSVIGINSAIQTRTGYYQGYGFAIPINMAKTVSEELIKFGKIERGYIGVSIKDVDSKEAKGFGLDKARGVLIQNVIKDGAGDEAGLKPGDIILSVNGKEVNAANQLQTEIGSKRPGDEVILKIFRDGKEFDQKVKLKPRTDNSNITDNYLDNNFKGRNNSEQKQYEKIGLTIIDLTDRYKKEFDTDYGVYIQNVSPYSEAFTRGLRAGIVILEVNKEKVNNVSEFDELVKDKKEGDVLVLKILLSNKEIRMVVLELK
ncbi:MAG: Do family serine endopeptidase [Ignavibacteria bacterium]|nr:Do family serine endopeptidase [Ignavibacteria bacterium]